MENTEKMEKAKENLRKIIYVDDITFHLMSVKDRLKKHYEIYTAQSVETLFKVLDNVIPDLILLDVNMPGADGFDVIRKLKADTRFSGVPVIFLTAQNDKQSIRTGLKLGAVDFVSKPFSDATLIECIEHVFNPEIRKDIKPSILAIDDDPSMLQSLNAILSDLYTVYTVPGVKEEKRIIEFLKKITPDLFLLDCNMPALSGLSIASLIRSIPLYEEIPIMFLTAENTMDNMYGAMEFEACEFLTKPIDREVLREKLALHLKDFILRRRMR